MCHTDAPFCIGGDFIKRLSSIINTYQNNESSFAQIHEGTINIVQGASRWVDYSSLYYNGDVGFEFSRTNRLSQNKPTVTVIIPVEIMFNGDENMKRLKYYLLKMDEKTATYTYTEKNKNNEPAKSKSMYDGELTAVLPPKSNGELLPSEIHTNPTFWSGDVSYTLERTNKLALDKPTITLSVPSVTLGIDTLNHEPLKIAAADALLREFCRFFEPLNSELYNRSRPDSENGRYYVYEPGGEVLVRNSAYFAVCPAKDYENGSGNTVYILPENKLKPPQLCFCVRMQVQFPTKKIRKTMKMLCSDLPGAVDEFIADFDRGRVHRAVELAAKQKDIRNFLRTGDYCAFIANESILPRDGDSQRPMIGAVPFRSTTEDEIEVAGVRGMGIKRGVTVLTGGGYSGKSTLLDAISAGIYNHCEGDGRELVICDDTAVDISAEDGRSVKNVNISPFIKWLPGASNTRDFSTARASGSTSQATNILEAVDSGSRLLLIDEDRSATNFMIRDKKMKCLIKHEPITPFTARVRELADRGVSTLLVIGGSGEYLSVADRVFMMDDYRISDVTPIARALALDAAPEEDDQFPADWKLSRGVYSGFSSYPEGRGSERLEFSETGFIIIGDEFIDTRPLHNLATQAQANSIGFILRELMLEFDGEFSFTERLENLYRRIANEGLDCIFSSFFVNCPRFLDLPRQIEVNMTLDRMRKVKRNR